MSINRALKLRDYNFVKGRTYGSVGSLPINTDIILSSRISDVIKL